MKMIPLLYLVANYFIEIVFVFAPALVGISICQTIKWTEDHL